MSVESNFAFALVLLYYALWLVNKIRVTFSTNEKQSQNQSFLAHMCFPTLGTGCMHLLQVLIGTCVVWIFVIGQNNYCFGFGFTALNWKPLYYQQWECLQCVTALMVTKAQHICLYQWIVIVSKERWPWFASQLLQYIYFELLLFKINQQSIVLAPENVFVHSWLFATFFTLDSTRIQRAPVLTSYMYYWMKLFRTTEQGTSTISVITDLKN